MSAVDRAAESRLNYLRRELELAEREAAREPFNVEHLPRTQRVPFELITSEIESARAAIPGIKAEIDELTSALGLRAWDRGER